MCVLSGPHVFDLNVGPLSSQNKKCFSLWFLPQQPWCDSQQQHVEKKKGKKKQQKKGHVSLQTFCQHAEAETYESETGAERKTQCLGKRHCIASRARWLATNRTSACAEVYHIKPKDELFIFVLANGSASLSQYFVMLWLASTPSTTTPGTKSWYAMLRAASCLKCTIPHPNCQQGAWFISIRPFANSTAFKNTNCTFRTGLFSPNLKWKWVKPAGLLYWPLAANEEIC